MTLRARQQWFQAVITHPQGVRAGMASEAARRHVGTTDPEAVVTRSQALPAARRLAIYAHAYEARLLECFRAEYPGLRHALGDEVFTGFVADFLAAYPPRSYTLHDLADRFPAHLAATAPPGEEWPGFVVDLATLERTFVEVFDGPGREGQPDHRPAVARALAAGDWSAVRPAPDLRVLALRFPVGAYLADVRRGGEPALPAAAASFVAVHRQDYTVRLHELDREGHELLTAALAGHGGEYRPQWVELGFFVPA